MTRRTRPQSKTDEDAFPVRVWFYVPERGLGRLMTPIYDWLDQNVGRTSYAVHSGGSNAKGDRIAVYFRHPADAHAFVGAFPSLELADGTVFPGYYSPQR